MDEPVMSILKTALWNQDISHAARLSIMRMLAEPGITCLAEVRAFAPGAWRGRWQAISARGGHDQALCLADGRACGQPVRGDFRRQRICARFSCREVLPRRQGGRHL